MSTTASPALIRLVLESLVEEGQMERLSALSFNAPDECDIAARAHALMVTALSLNDVAADQVRRGIENHTETLVYATLALVYKLTGECLDLLRSAALADEAKTSRILERCWQHVSSLEHFCQELYRRINDDSQHIRFENMLEESQSILAQARLARVLAGELKRG